MNAFEVLADDTRREIVAVLRKGEQPVNDIVGQLEIHQSGVSRHLKILTRAGFVNMRPEGQRRLYSLRPEPFAELDSWLSDYRSLWEARLERFERALHERQRRRVRRQTPRRSRHE